MNILLYFSSFNFFLLVITVTSKHVCISHEYPCLFCQSSHTHIYCTEFFHALAWGDLSYQEVCQIFGYNVYKLFPSCSILFHLFHLKSCFNTFLSCLCMKSPIAQIQSAKTIQRITASSVLTRESWLEGRLLLLLQLYEPSNQIWTFCLFQYARDYHCCQRL